MEEGGWFGWKDVWRKEKKVGGGSHHKLSTKKWKEMHGSWPCRAA